MRQSCRNISSGPPGFCAPKSPRLSIVARRRNWSSPWRPLHQPNDRGKTDRARSLLVPMDANVYGRAPDGDDVDAAVAVQVGRREVLDRHAVRIDELPFPLFALTVATLIEPHTATDFERIGHLRVVADADD